MGIVVQNPQKPKTANALSAARILVGDEVLITLAPLVTVVSVMFFFDIMIKVFVIAALLYIGTKIKRKITGGNPKVLYFSAEQFKSTIGKEWYEILEDMHKILKEVRTARKNLSGDKEGLAFDKTAEVERNIERVLWEAALNTKKLKFYLDRNTESITDSLKEELQGMRRQAEACKILSDQVLRLNLTSVSIISANNTDLGALRESLDMLCSNLDELKEVSQMQLGAGSGDVVYKGEGRKLYDRVTQLG